MCVAIVIPDEDDVVVPTAEECREMEEINPHGAGVAWAAEGRVRWLKGLDATTVAALVKSLPRPLLVHFRWASAGGQSKGLCHPFPINQRADTRLNGDAYEVLIHNGHWSGWEGCMKSLVSGGWKLPKGAWSDTRLAAHLIAESEKDDRDEIISTVGGRIATLAGDGSWAAHGHWEKVGGVHYSNTYWRGGRHITPYSRGDITTDSDWWKEYLSKEDEIPSLPSLASGSVGSGATERFPDWDRARHRRGHSKYFPGAVIDVDSDEE